MKLHMGLLIALMAAILISGSYGISVSVTSSVGGYSETISSGEDQPIEADSAITGNSVSNSISGKGDLYETHFTYNDAGAIALVTAVYQMHRDVLTAMT